MTETDAELVARCRAADDTAFHSLVRRYAPRLFEVILRMVGNAALAEDLLQDTLMQAYQALPRFRGQSGFYTWLYRIGVNRALGWLRKEKAARGVASLDEHDDEHRPLEIPDWSGNPERHSTQRELADCIDAAVMQLGESLRIVFLLREMEGLSFEEIAQILDCSQDVVRARLYRGKKILKTVLRPYLEATDPGNKEKEGRGR